MPSRLLHLLSFFHIATDPVRRLLATSPRVLLFFLFLSSFLPSAGADERFVFAPRVGPSFTLFQQGCSHSFPLPFDVDCHRRCLIKPVSRRFIFPLFFGD